MRRLTKLPLLLLTALAATACSSDPWDDPAIGDPFVPDPRVVRRVGLLFEDGSPRLVAATGGAAVPAGDRALWLVSDVRLGFGDAATTSRSAVVLTRGGDWPGSDGLEVAGDALPESCPPPEGLDRRWLSGIAVSDVSDVLLYFAATRPGADDESSLDYLGAGVARRAAGGVRIATRADGDWRFFGRGDPIFGMAVLQADQGVTTGFDYVFGVRGDAGTNRVYVARVPHGRGDERDAYRFHTDSGEWTADVRDAAPLFRAGPQGLSVSWNAHLQAFLAVYAWTLPGKEGEPDRIRVLARASRRPDGPWSRETPLFETRGPVAPGRVRPDAGAREHPQLARQGGRVLFVSVDAAGESVPSMWRVELPEVR